MSTQNSTSLAAGAPITWQDSGGTFAMTLQNLATTVSRQGPKSATLMAIPSGLGSSIMPELLEVTFQCKMTSTPTAGDEVELYLGFSGSVTVGSDNPAGLSGTDAALGNNDQLPQLVFAGSIVLSAGLTTNNQEVKLFVKPLDQYVIPVIHNAAGVNLANTSNVTIVTILPWFRVGSN